MKEGLEQRLLSMVDKAGGVLDQAWVTGEEQIPILIQEVLQYQDLISSIYCILLLILLVVIYAPIIFITYKWWLNDASYKWLFDDADLTFLWVITGLISFIPIVLLIINLTTLIKVYVAPRLFILEYISNLIN